VRQYVTQKECDIERADDSKDSDGLERHRTDYERHATIDQSYRARCNGVPDDIAVIDGDTWATYRQLSDRAASVANRLSAHLSGNDPAHRVLAHRAITRSPRSSDPEGRRGVRSTRSEFPAERLRLHDGGHRRKGDPGGGKRNGSGASC